MSGLTPSERAVLDPLETPYTPEENVLAEALFRAIADANAGTHMSGPPSEAGYSFVDGIVDFRRVARLLNLRQRPL